MMHGLTRLGGWLLACVLLAACGTTSAPDGGPDDGPDAGPDAGGSGWAIVGDAASGARDVATDPEGRAVVVGEIVVEQGEAFPDTDALVTMHDATGAVVWTRRLGTPEGDSATDAAAEEDGSIYVTGSTSGDLAGASAGVSDVFVVKLDADGEEIWSTQFGSDAADRGAGVTVAADGAVYVVGRTFGDLTSDGGAEGLELFLARLGADGEIDWVRQVGSGDGDVASDVTTDANGDVYVVGQTRGSFGGHASRGADDVLVLKFDAEGTLLWSRQLGSPELDDGNAVAVHGEDVWVVGSSLGSFEGQPYHPIPDSVYTITDAVVVQLDAGTGDPRWIRQVGSADSDSAWGVAADADGAYVVGWSQGQFDGLDTITNGDMFVVRYDADGTKRWSRMAGTDGDDEASGAAMSADGALYAVGRTRDPFDLIHRPLLMRIEP